MGGPAKIHTGTKAPASTGKRIMAPNKAATVPNRAPPKSGKGMQSAKR